MQDLFSRFADRIASLPSSEVSSECVQQFVLDESERVRVVYAPFEWVNPDAKLVIVGITPGYDSMIAALRTAGDELRAGEPRDEVLKRARRTGSFSNMRSTIAEMLDAIGIPAALGLAQPSDLFTSRYDLLHPTACVRYPVFVRNKAGAWVNYTGHRPKLTKCDVLRPYFDLLVEELRLLPQALIIPCGEIVTEVLRLLFARGVIENPDRCLFGFPHASGANGHRNRFFEQRKTNFSAAVSKWAESQSLTVKC